MHRPVRRPRPLHIARGAIDVALCAVRRLYAPLTRPGVRRRSLGSGSLRGRSLGSWALGSRSPAVRPLGAGRRTCHGAGRRPTLMRAMAAGPAGVLGMATMKGAPPGFDARAIVAPVPAPMGASPIPGPLPIIRVPIVVERERDQRHGGRRGVAVEGHIALLAVRIEVVGGNPAPRVLPRHVAPLVVADAAMDGDFGILRDEFDSWKARRRAGPHVDVGRGYRIGGSRYARNCKQSEQRRSERHCNTSHR